MILWHRRAAELAGCQPRCNLGIAPDTLRDELGTPAILDPVSEIDLQDPLAQLFVRVSSILEQRPHAVDDENQPVDTVMEVKDVLDPCAGAIGRYRCESR